MCLVAAILYTLLAMSVAVLTIYFTAHGPQKTCKLQFKRTMKSSLVPSSRPRSVAPGDLNNDRQIDFVVANSGTNTIEIFISQGNGTFANEKTYSTDSGSRPYSIALSDFNNDSYADIVVANYDTNSIGLFLGHGNGTFNNQILISLGSSHPLFVTTSDFNNDKRIDIAVVNNGTNSISILLGYGNGSFKNQTIYSTDYDSFPSSLAVGDFNNDTYLDVVVTNSGTNNIGIFLNYGNGTFLNQQIYTTNLNSHPLFVAVGDLNNDNQLDIVVANYGNGAVGIFFGYGNGSFLPQIIYVISSSARPQYISIYDMNNDNLSDIIIGDSSNDRIYILLGYGNNSFETILRYDEISGSMPISLAVNDFNNNSQSDIVVVNYGTNNIVVLLDYSPKPSAAIGDPCSSTELPIISPIAVNDFNNDSIPDIVFYGKNYLAILIGLGNETFLEERTYLLSSSLMTQYICSGDLNKDDRIDIVMADAADNSVHVLLGYGNGTFTPMTTYSTGIESRPYWAALGDLNNDNVLDIVSANFGTNTIGILFGNGNGTFAPLMTYSTGDGVRPCSVALGDINNDKHLDMVATHQNGRLVIFLQHSNSTFIITATYLTNSGTASMSVALADFNRDNYLDIVVTNTLIDNIGILLGYGDGTFGSQITYSTGFSSQPYYAIITDFNNNTLLDIVVSNFGTSEVVIFYGHDNGSFELSRNFSTGYGSKPMAIEAADFNNDEKLEIVVSLWGTKDIAILTEYYAAEFIKKTVYIIDSAPQPSSLTIGDFNNDNQSDIIVANSGTDSLSILLASGNGTFGTEIIYSVDIDSHPQYVISCDINNDNQLDIVSVNSKMNNINVIMGSGNGSFAEQIIYLTGENSHPYAAIAGDLNNDNRLDLVIANEGTGSLGIFFGFNYTSFRPQDVYSSDDKLGPGSIVSGDFNNDNIPDISAVFSYNDSLCIFLGRGDGSFSTMQAYSTEINSSPHSINVGDFNNDNQSDIVVANTGTQTIGVFLGYGNGSFASMMMHSTGNDSHPIYVAVADLDKNGHSDIVVVNDESDNIAVLRGLGNGRFTNMTKYSTGKRSRPRAVIIADFNKDIYLDIAVVNSFTANVGILFGREDATFADQVIFILGPNTFPYWIIVSDFNRDNQLDIATANYGVSTVNILLGYGNGNFTSAKNYSTGIASQPSCIRLGDFNNDNISDIAVVNSGTNNIVVLFGYGDGSFLSGRPYSTSRSKPWGLVVDDFNKDGQLDIVIVTDTPNTIELLLGYSSQPFGNMMIQPIGQQSKPHSVSLGHFNNDMWLDIVVANYGTASINILYSQRDKPFDNIRLNLTGNGSAPNSVAVANFNNDTYSDIAVAYSGTDNIAILLFNGNGTITREIIYSTGTGSRPYSIATADFNNDTIQDIAVANSGTNNILLLYGYGNGTFGNQQTYPLDYDYRPYAIVAQDIDGDGWIDLAAACYGTNHVEVLIKIC